MGMTMVESSLSADERKKVAQQLKEENFSITKFNDRVDPEGKVQMRLFKVTYRDKVMWIGVSPIKITRVPRMEEPMNMGSGDPLTVHKNFLQVTDQFLTGLNTSAITGRGKRGYIPFMSVVLGEGDHVKLFYAVVKRGYDLNEVISELLDRREALKGALTGAFSQIDYTSPTREETNTLFDIPRCCYVVAITGIPSRSGIPEDPAIGGRSAMGGDEGGIEQKEVLLRGGLGCQYRLISVGEPITLDTLLKATDWMKDVASDVKSNVEGQTSWTGGMSFPMMSTFGMAQSHADSTNYTHAISLQDAHTQGVARSISETRGTTHTLSDSHSTGISTQISDQIQQTTGISHGLSAQHGVTTSESTAHGTNYSFAESLSEGRQHTVSFQESQQIGEAHSRTLSEMHGQAYSDQYSVSQGVTEGLTTSRTQGVNQQWNQNQGWSTGASQNYSAQQSYGQNHSMNVGQSITQGFGEQRTSTLNIGHERSTAEQAAYTYGQQQSIGQNWSQGTSSGTTSSWADVTSHQTSTGRVDGGSDSNVVNGVTVTNTSGSSHGTTDLSQSGSHNWGETWGDSWGGSVSVGGFMGTPAASADYHHSTSGQSGYSQNTGLTVSDGTSGSTSTSTIQAMETKGTNWSNSSGVSDGYSQSLGGSYSSGAQNSWGGSNTYGVSQSNTIGQSYSMGDSVGIGKSTGVNVNYSQGSQTGETWGDSSGYSYGYGNSVNQGYQWGSGYGYGVSDQQGVARSVGTQYTQGETQGVTNSYQQGTSIGDTYSSTYGIARGQSDAISMSRGIQNQYGVSDVNTKGVASSDTQGTSDTYSQGSGVSRSQGYGTQSALTSGVADGVSQSVATGTTSSDSVTASRGVSDASGLASTTGRVLSSSISGGIAPYLMIGKSTRTINVKNFWVGELLDVNLKRYERGKGEGMWKVATVLTTSTRRSFERMLATIRAAFNAPNSRPNPIQCEVIEDQELAQYVFLRTLLGGVPNISRYDNFHGFGLDDLEFATALSTYEFTSYVHPPREEFAGLDVQMENIPKCFRVPSETPGDINFGWIFDVQTGRHIGERLNMQVVDPRNGQIKLGHFLISAATGSGKTNWALLIERQMMLNRVIGGRGLNVLILDWKNDHRKLLNMCPTLKKEGKLLVFTLNERSVAPYVGNPLRPPVIKYSENQDERVVVDPYDWANYMAELFAYCFVPSLRAKSIFYQTLTRLYDDMKVPENHGDPDFKGYPTLQDVYDAIDARMEEAKQERGSQGEMESLSAILSRLIYYTMGKLVKDFGKVRVGIPVEELWNGDRNTILEAGNITDNSDKKFLLGWIAIACHAYHRKVGKPREIPLVTVLEEAHQIIPPESRKKEMNIEESIFDTAFRENRGYNLFYIAIAQMPSALSPQVLMNTPGKMIMNTGVTAEGQDTDLITQQLGKDPRYRHAQVKRFLSRMPQGLGIVRFPYAGNMAEPMRALAEHEPVLVEVPWLPEKSPTNEELREYMRPYILAMDRDETALNEDRSR